MRPFRFLHAADLHLDAAFKGVTAAATHSRSLPGAYGHPTNAGVLPQQNTFPQLTGTTFTALDALVALAITQNVDVVLLAGDIYNAEDASVKAQLALRSAFQQLEEQGIPVAMVHGNHDPLTSRLHAVQWPDNVTVFPPDTASSMLLGDTEEPTAVIHGISYGKKREMRNLARKFARSPHDCYQIGLLHCTVETKEVARTVKNDNRYAPCSIADLLEAELDYWALGHVHERQVLHSHPWIVYPGNIQGLHINEQHVRGCLIGDVAKDGNTALRFYPLGPVYWHNLSVPIDGHTSLDTLERTLLEQFETTCTKLASEEFPQCISCKENSTYETAHHPTSPTPHDFTGALFRLTLTGRGPLNAILRRQGVTEDLLERLREGLQGHTPAIWIKDIDLTCRPEADMDALQKRPDLLGETLRHALELEKLFKQQDYAEETPISTVQPERTAVPTNELFLVTEGTTSEQNGFSPEEQKIRETLLQDLYALYGNRRIAKYLEPLSENEIAALLHDAQALCIEHLEAE